MKRKKNLGLLFVAFSLLVSCNSEKKQTTPDTEPTHREPQEEKTKEVKAPEQIISITDAKEDYDNYTKKRAQLIEKIEDPLEDGSKFIASRYGDYDIETVKNYIAYVEQEAKEAGVKVETLRFYFSTYPDKKDFPDHKEVKHPRQNSFFILPTIKVDAMNMGFYIKDLGDGKKEAALIRDYPGILDSKMGDTHKKTNKSYASFLPATTAPLMFAEESLIMNTIQMSPPPPKGSDFN
ncbi:hypothetical protein H0I25_06755 [Cellulophaga sp. HaHa_2_95]|uniref:hypothetical protein n=1 Tax=Cellulophaga sp. HaHa_2_95 TaxID=2745558 RepID=UPI001C5008B7|nr:hypothetical protein [Cellulophaga sp. HaHa_2_95]QXP57480.1 hypothetical protein H0I25_06755 [Cellulophaga sp. HaHa_2_95]